MGTTDNITAWTGWDRDREEEVSSEALPSTQFSSLAVASEHRDSSPSPSSFPSRGQGEKSEAGLFPSVDNFL